MPAKCSQVALCFELGGATVVVPEDQLSLAIGKEGQNVRLAHRLTGWRIDIKSLSQIEATQGSYNYDEQEEYGEEEGEA